MNELRWRLASEMTEYEMVRLAALRAEVRLTHSITPLRLVRWGGDSAHGRGTTARLENTHGSRFTKSKKLVRMVAVPTDFTRENHDQP